MIIFFYPLIKNTSSNVPMNAKVMLFWFCHHVHIHIYLLVEQENTEMQIFLNVFNFSLQGPFEKVINVPDSKSRVNLFFSNRTGECKTVKIRIHEWGRDHALTQVEL